MNTETYYYAIMADYGYGDGWEEVSAYDVYGDAVEDLNEYLDNMPEYDYKIAKVREDR